MLQEILDVLMESRRCAGYMPCYYPFYHQVKSGLTCSSNMIW
jgi:hypothetical protein